MSSHSSLFNKLGEIYSTYHSPHYLQKDPLILVHTFKGTPSLEAVAFTTAILSYGKVELIIRAVTRLLEITGDLNEFISHTGYTQKQQALSDWKYRFHTGDDLARHLTILKKVYTEEQSLGHFATKLWNESNHDTTLFFNLFTTFFKEEGLKLSPAPSSQFRTLYPSPAGNSACKRIAMFLRWMVRNDDGIDLGLWKDIPTSALVIPVDTHVARIAQSLKLTSRKDQSWRTAIEITNHLKKFDSDDPVKFDFSLCRYGMLNGKTELD